MIAFCQTKIPLKSIFFRLKRAYFADELGIIKIRTLGSFWETFGEPTVKAVGTVTDA